MSVYSFGGLDDGLQKLGLGNRPPSQYNSFYTPENSFFYGKTPYLRLEPSRQEIRLLRVKGLHPIPTRESARHESPDRSQAIQRGNDFRRRKPAPVSRDPVQKNVIQTPRSRSRSREGFDREVFDVARQISRTKCFDRDSDDQPGGTSTILICELVDKVSLSRASGNYCALSYCAGKPSDNAWILVDGIPFRAFSNLEYALRSSLDTWKGTHPTQELLIWVDQICINQSDHQERSSQVSLMRQIYRRSNETFVSLSTPNAGGCLSWAFENTISEGEHDIQGTQDTNPPRRPWTVDRLKAFLDIHLKATAPNSKNEFLAWISSLMSFMDSGIWTRAWIYQELILSPRPWLMAEPYAVSWFKISQLVSFVCFDLEPYVDSKIADARQAVKQAYIDRDRILEQYHRDLWKYENEISKISTRLSESLTVDRAVLHRQLRNKKDAWFKEQQRLSHDILLVKQEEEGKGNWERVKTWKLRRSTQLQDLETQHSEMAQNRFELNVLGDRVLQLHDDLSKEIRKCDLSCWELSPDLTNMSKELTDTWLAVLRICRNRALPISPVEDTRLDLLDILRVSRSQGSAFRPPLPPQSPNVSLRMRRENINLFKQKVRSLSSRSVASIVSKKAQRRLIKDIKEHLVHSRSCEASDPRDRVYAFLGLSDPGYNIIPRYDYDNTIVHVLIETAKKIIAHENSLDILAHVGAGRDKLCCYIPTWVPDWTSRPVDNGFQRFASLHNAGQNGRPFGISDRMATVVKYREDVANSINVDINIYGVMIGTLDVLEDRIAGFRGLQAFSTPSGGTVVTSASVLIDDQVWILQGASKPVILRQEGETYSFLCEALCYTEDGTLAEAMFGSFEHPFNEGQGRWQRIWIT